MKNKQERECLPHLFLFFLFLERKLHIMKTFAWKKSAPFILSVAVAFTALPGFVTPMVMDVPIGIATAYAAVQKEGDFSQDIGAWTCSGNYNYSSKAEAAYDPAFGGSLKLTVDFSKDKEETWSEVKLSDTSITPETPLVFSEPTKWIEFDLYYDPAKLGGDSAFKVKVFGKDDKGEEVINDLQDKLGTAHAIEGSNLKRIHVKCPFMDEFTGKLGHLEVSVVSYLSSYQGDVYINNIKM